MNARKKVNYRKAEIQIIMIEVIVTVVCAVLAVWCIVGILRGLLWPVAALPIFGFIACVASEDAQRIYEYAKRRKV